METPQKVNKVVLEGWDVSTESVQKSMDIVPLLQIGKYEIGQNFIVVPMANEPKIIEYEDKQTHEKGSFKVLPVFEIVGTQYVKEMLPVSSKTLQMELRKIQEVHKTLVGVGIQIYVTEIDYKKFGKDRGYKCVVLTGEQKQKIDKMNLHF